jgi:TonB-linked SusC/RagA family outer membrane protein
MRIQGLTKTLLVMKLTGILLIASMLQVSARGTAQTVTYAAQATPLTKVFAAIEQQTGYVFFYNSRDLQGVTPVTVQLKAAPLRDALQNVLAGQPLAFDIQGNTIVITRIEREVSPDTIRAFRGRVNDSLGHPLAGASVTIKGTKKGTNTNGRGEFTFKNLPDDAVLVISYTGYNDKEIRPNPNFIMYIVLQRSEDVLDATVIQAYGTTSRRFSVGSISTVDAETIGKQPVTNVLLALQGQAPGLAINATSGVPGSRVQLQIRGQNTVLSNTGFAQFRPYDQPLFIVDGVPFAPQNKNISQLSSLASSSNSGDINQAGGISPFNNINPADIESISILKDADATSIYGTQGSNGVILITTKKGKPGKTNFNLAVNTGFNTSTRTLKLMNTAQYLQMRKDAFAADGATPSNDPFNFFAYAPDLLVFDQNKYTDWQKVIFGKTSNNTDLHASLSGGTLNNTFLISTGYTRSDFNYPGNFADQRFTLHAVIHHTSADNHFTVDFGTDYGYEQNNSSAFSGARDILLPPNTPDLRDPAGNLLWSYKGADLTGYQFYGYLKQAALLQTYNLNNTLRIGYKILPGLSIGANLGYSRNTTSEHGTNPAAAQNPSYPYVTADFNTNNFQTINIEPQIDYTTTIGKGVLTALVGGTYKKNVNNSNTTRGTGYANDNFLGSINGASSISSYDNYDLYKYSAGFGRLKYVYDQKYIVSLTGRRDGSSYFGPGHQFGNFGSAGLGWIFSEERAFKSAIHFISFAKLSGNYGTTGSDGIASYKYQDFWQPVNNAAPVQGIHPNYPVNLYNPDYSWALKKSLNLALDLGFFHDRVLLNATFYRGRESSQLAGYPLPAQVGFPTVLENVNSTVQNQGWEFSLTSNNIKTKAVTWTTTFNISINRNKLISFPNLESSSYNSFYVVGKPTSVVMGSKFKGLNPTTGLFEYYTKDGHVTTNPTSGIAAAGGDYVPIADREVKFMGGFGNTLTYKHFSLYVFFQFSKQTAPNWLSTVYSSYAPGLRANNLPVEAANYWKQPGDQTPLQKLTSSYFTNTYTAAGNFGSSSGAFSDDTYMRLKTLSLSYTLPDATLRKLHIQDCRIYVNAQNLLTFTDYKVADPETFNDFTAFPLQRIVAFGLSFNF